MSAKSPGDASGFDRSDFFRDLRKASKKLLSEDDASPENDEQENPITATFMQSPDDGCISIELKGHATNDDNACASICGIMLAATEGIRRLAELYPDDVRVVE